LEPPARSDAVESLLHHMTASIIMNKNKELYKYLIMPYYG